MRKTLPVILALGLVPVVAAGCVSKAQYLKTVQNADQLDQDLRSLKGRYDTLEADNERVKADRADLEQALTAKAGELGKTIVDLRQRIDALDGDNTRLTRELAESQQALAQSQQARDEKLREVSSTYEQLVDKMKGEIDKGQVTISELKGKLTVNMVEAILFDSGKADIKADGLVVLGKVTEILKNVNDKAIRIEGHTDNVPIQGTLAQRYPTNWELSAARAINVARYLQKQAIDPALLSAAAFGEFKPVADNVTEEGRAKNRRIEIVLVPKD